jgi:hypothetical protein
MGVANGGLVQRRGGRIVLLIILIAAVVLQVLNWPHRYEVRDGDEVGYLDSSLVLVEGIAPGFKPSPAGPQIWLGWTWAYARIAWNLIHPGPYHAHLPVAFRPFVAMNQALFSIYRDMSAFRQMEIAVNVAVVLIAVLAAFAFGRMYAGTAGGLLVGGLVAVLPIIVAYSAESRPYSMAWSFGIIAIWAAARHESRRIWMPAVLLGLAIGSRIEMLLLTPVILWQIWDNRPPGASLARRFVQLIAIAALTAYAVAPWLLTGLPGNLRVIWTVQFANPNTAAITAKSILLDFVWTNGFGPALLLLLMAIPLWLFRRNVRQFVLALIVLALIASIFKSTGYGLHHHGPAFVALIMLCAPALAAVRQKSLGAAWLFIAAALLLPLIQTSRMIVSTWHPNDLSAAHWVQRHVPAGTIVYMNPQLATPLPTAHAADMIWDDLTNSQAWRRKIAWGLERFGFLEDQLPRAMSEENMVQVRGNLRRFFILGWNDNRPEPRYDLRIIEASPVFGVQDVAAAFAKTGGVVIWRGDGVPPKLGKPLLVLSHVDGAPATIFCSPGVHLLDMQAR